MPDESQTETPHPQLFYGMGIVVGFFVSLMLISVIWAASTLIAYIPDWMKIALGVGVVLLAGGTVLSAKAIEKLAELQYKAKKNAE